MCLRIVASVPHGGETIGKKRKVIIDGEEFKVDVEVMGNNIEPPSKDARSNSFYLNPRVRPHENEVQAVVESEVVPSG
ncbi:MAG: hypothetical protein Ct9H90mP16_13360 [Candidatus Poseidoniales archaeon]|nr:MAG: hypothetical protein Ct9H90mP16_13360 [Candidatus Poseidoniales archaeon]